MLSLLVVKQAKFNVLRGRYPMKTENYFTLAGIQAAVHEGVISEDEQPAGYQ